MRLIIDVVEGLSVADKDECWWHVDVVTDLVMASTAIQGGSKQRVQVSGASGWLDGVWRSEPSLRMTGYPEEHGMHQVISNVVLYQQDTCSCKFPRDDEMDEAGSCLAAPPSA